MNLLLQILSWLSFALIALVGAFATWAYGAWEMWYFWPFAGLIFLAAFLQGARLLIRALVDSQDPDGPMVHQLPKVRIGPTIALIICCLPFLIYATIRFLQTPVFMEAQRSYLLHATSVLLVLCTLFGFSRQQVKWLLGIIGVSILLQVIAGPIWLFHPKLNDNYVLFREIPEAAWKNQYAGRAKSSFFCPDHYSGLMEMGICLALGIGLTRKTRWWSRALLALSALGCSYGVIISKSRGGGLAIVFLLLGTLVVGFYAWRPRARWALRGVVTIAGVILLAVGVFAARDYTARFKDWHLWNPKYDKADLSVSENLTQKFLLTSRGRMITGALRAWKNEPIWGIGPGMHANVWFRFAATDDGDRETAKWPSINNYGFHSYEVHSDWVQLLEEYGIVGLSLLVIGFVCIVVLLWRRLLLLAPPKDPPHIVEQGAPLASLLTLAAIGFHSLGDFNLQIPGNTWTFALIIAAGLSTTLTYRQRPRPVDDDE